MERGVEVLALEAAAGARAVAGEFVLGTLWDPEERSTADCGTGDPEVR